MSTEDSLLRLFNSEVFTYSMLLEYLTKSQSPGVLTYLTNKLYSYPAQESEFYIPQLLNLSFYKPSLSDIQKVLLQFSIDSHTFALSFHCHLSAFINDCQSAIKPIATELFESLDMVIVNSKLPKQRSNLPPDYFFNLPSGESELEVFSRKSVRSKYYSYQQQIINLLCKISVGLNQVLMEERNTKLRVWLQSVNKTMKSTREQHRSAFESVSKLFRGPVIGMSFHSDSDECVSQMVRIVPEHCLCFSTKSRVPYKLVYETVGVEDYELSSESFSVNSHNDEGIEDITRVDIEKIKKILQKGECLEDLTQGVYAQGLNLGSSRKGSDPLEANSMVDIWGENWESIRDACRRDSPFGSFHTWKLRAVIIKGLDDLRQEYFAMQIITKIKKIWDDALLSLYVRTYEIKVISDYMGIIEFIPDTLSIHSIKKSFPNFSTLSSFYKQNWESSYEEAQRNFVRSMAGYSLICYLLNIKDRHNANILIDNQGHLIHIDFGFFLTTSPGGNMGFESAPFKLSQELIEVMDGVESEIFGYFKILLFQGFLEIRKHANQLIVLLEGMGKCSGLACLQDFEVAVEGFRERMQLGLTDEKCLVFIEGLVYESQNNWRTAKYDDFQYLTNGIL